MVEPIHKSTRQEREKWLAEAYNNVFMLKSDQVYTFKVALCDNEVDRDFEHFTIDALQQLAELFRGKTGITDHSMRSDTQMARIYKTEIVTDDSKRTSVGEPYTQLVAYAYMARSEKNIGFINEIELGIKKEVSVSCSLAESKCSICGADLRRCSHILGKEYDGKLCSASLDCATDAYEFSFVAVPAQRAAGVLKGNHPELEREPYPEPVPEKEEKQSALDGILAVLKNKTKNLED